MTTQLGYHVHWSIYMREGFMAADAAVVGDGQGGGVNIVNAGLLSQAAEQEAHQGHEHALFGASRSVRQQGMAGKYCRSTSPIIPW